MVGILKQFYQRNFSDPQASFLAIMIVVGFSVVILMGKMLLPVIAGIVIAYLLNDVVNLLFRCRIPRPYAVWVVFLLFIALLFVIIFALTPLLSEQLTRLVGELPLMLAQGQKLLLTLPDQYPLVTEDQVDELIATIQNQITNLGKI